MNRRHFLKFIPLIPVAIGLVNAPKPAESSNLTSIEDIIARQRALTECFERTGTIPAPANGRHYSEEELEILRSCTKQWIKEKLDQSHLQEILHQKIREAMTGRGPNYSQ